MKEVNQLKQEIRSLRSFVISVVGKDPEGNYKPEFVQRVHKAVNDKTIYAYTGPGSLLKQLKNL